MKQYHEMLKRIRDEGVKTEDRTGTGTTSVFGHQARFNLQEGFPMVTTKRVPFKALAAELEWFLQGNTNNNRLNELGTTIWNEWANDDGNLGPIYGAMWRRWPVGQYETHLVEDKHHLGDDTRLSGVKDGMSMTLSNNQWATDEERTIYKLESELFNELLNEGNVCIRWYHLKTFAEDLASIPGYELWKAHRTKYVLSIKYFNARFFSPDTCIFVPVEYEASLKDELTPVTITKESGAKSTISTLDDLEEFVGVSHLMMYVVQTERVLVNKESIVVDLGLFNSQQAKEEIIIEPYEIPKGKLVRRKLYVDQIANLMETLKNNPTSRRMVVSGWNPTLLPDTNDSFENNINNGKQALPPCHTLFQFNTRPLNEKERLVYGAGPEYVLNCQLYMRSNDVPLGAGFNIASYALLTELIAHEVGMVAGEFIYTVGDLHVYNNQLDIYQVLEREPYPLPKLKIKDSFNSIFDFKVDDVELIDYVSHGHIKLPVSI